MANCACCNGELPASSIVGELCSECTEAMEEGMDPPPDGSALPIPIEFAGMDEWTFIAPEADKYPVTRTLILINVCMYVVCVVLSLRSMEKLFEWGMEWGPATLAGQWWRMFSAMFLHAGLAHLFGNMWWFWVVGKLAEQIFTRWTFLSLYLLTGLVGEVASLNVHPELHTLGASGAIFGITGVMIAALWLRRLPPSMLRMSWRVWPLMIFSGLSLYGGAMNQHVDNAAHVGGLVSGLFLGVLLTGRSGHAPVNANGQRRVFAGLILLLVLGAISLRLHYSDILPLQTAQQALEAGRLEEAARIARAVTEKRPTDVQAFLFLGKIYVRAGDYRHAVDSIDYALKLDPDNRDAARLRRDAAWMKR
jgi:membrane associated rhomboid family serine protease